MWCLTEEHRIFKQDPELFYRPILPDRLIVTMDSKFRSEYLRQHASSEHTINHYELYYLAIRVRAGLPLYMDEVTPSQAIEGMIAALSIGDTHQLSTINSSTRDNVCIPRVPRAMFKYGEQVVCSMVNTIAHRLQLSLFYITCCLHVLDYPIPSRLQHVWKVKTGIPDTSIDLVFKYFWSSLEPVQRLVIIRTPKQIYESARRSVLT